MRVKHVKELVKKAIPNKLKLLFKGAPGCGKTEASVQGIHEAGYDSLVVQAAFTEPIDTKGLPASYKENGKLKADFIPFGWVDKITSPEGPAIGVVFDDLGHGSPMVQSSLMHPLQAREILGRKIRDNVSFIAATNDRTHSAGVNKLITPLLSRFHSIVEVEAHIDDWVEWALNEDLPVELIAHLRSMPAELSKFDAKVDFENFPCPRTWKHIGDMLKSGIKDIETFTGAVGKAAAAQFMVSLKQAEKLPDLRAILKDPDAVPMLEEAEAGLRHAVCIGLAKIVEKKNFGNAITYIQRMDRRMLTVFVTDSTSRDDSLCNTEAYSRWVADNQELFKA